MIFKETPLKGAYLLEPESYEDERGSFTRTFCAKEFRARGLVDRFVQCSTSWNARLGTLRGMHFQQAPSSEVKVVRCTRGRIWDVLVDLRPASDSYLKWYGVELSADNRKSVYIPEMFAHGFLSLEDGAEVYYQMSEFFSPEHARGVRFDDPKLGIAWPGRIEVIGAKDLGWELLR